MDRPAAFLMASIAAGLTLTAGFNMPALSFVALEWSTIAVLGSEALIAVLLTIAFTVLPWLAAQAVADRTERAAPAILMGAALLPALIGNALTVLFGQSLAEGDPDAIGLAQAWWRFFPMFLIAGVIGGVIYIFLSRSSRGRA